MTGNEGVRLQKVLAAAGVASRRAAEILIDEGRVQVNGAVVREQGVRVDPAADVVKVDGKRIPPQRAHKYLILNKPRGVVSAMEDATGRSTLADLLGRYSRDRVFHVGRLDIDTEGLLLLTNDGDFAQRLTHPSYEVPKTYLAEVSGRVDAGTLNRLRKGVDLEDGMAVADKVRLIQPGEGKSAVEIVLHSGRNRVVRRMFDAVGHPVRRLVRTGVGPLRLAKLKPGELRELTGAELASLFDLVGM
ncbi:MAG: rRNA pseudouridine synthase [Propionibacteriaceae bacterium]|nr:rRNA pseudouridine synthase [Propionibacteriaceae bacterium]